MYYDISEISLSLTPFLKKKKYIENKVVIFMDREVPTTHGLLE